MWPSGSFQVGWQNPASAAQQPFQGPGAIDAASATVGPPLVVVSTPAGVGGTASVLVGSNLQRGVVVVNTGTSGTTSGVLCGVYFTATSGFMDALPQPPFDVFLTKYQPNPAVVAPAVYVITNVDYWNLGVDVALPANGSFCWCYEVVI